MAAIQLTIYVWIFVKLRRQDRVVDGSHSKIAKTMLLFPLTYLFTIMPLAVFRIAALAGVNLDVSEELIGGGIFSCAGTFNVIIYTFTRRLISFNHSPTSATISESLFTISLARHDEEKMERRPSYFSFLSTSSSKIFFTSFLFLPNSTLMKSTFFHQACQTLPSFRLRSFGGQRATNRPFGSLMCPQ